MWGGPPQLYDDRQSRFLQRMESQVDDATPDDFVNAIDSSSSNHTVPTESIGGQMVLSRRQRSYGLCVASAILICANLSAVAQQNWQSRNFRRRMPAC